MARRKDTLEIADALGQPAADKRVEILRRVGEAGSISQAAREAGVSYKAAWQALDTLSNLAGAPLVERAVGGAGGGGATLSDAGKRLLRAADELARARRNALARLGSASAGAAALGLKTSMRNQLPCRVRELRKQGGAMNVVLELPGGAQLVSRITVESAQLLALKKGQDVLALCKATAVEVRVSVARDDSRNVIDGRVTRASRAAGGGEVAVALEGGLQVVGFAKAGHGLRVRSDAVVCIDPAAVVVAAG